tara:strand:+ start:1469 stop:1732 length:264 start_codon:yes stop_codon:yes gene_type:complete
MHTAQSMVTQHIHKGEMMTMDTQIDYSDDMMRLRRDAILSLKEFGFGKNIYEFCTDWVLQHDTTHGIREAFKEYETKRPNQINQICT